VIRVALVDDHAVVRRGLRALLESYADLRVVGEASSGEEALAQLAGWQAAGVRVLVMDLLMPGGMDGVEAIRRARSAAPQMQIVALTSSTEDEQVVAALQAGALSYVRKDADPEALLAAVRTAARGQAYLDAAVSAALARALRRDPTAQASAHPAANSEPTLTAREHEVLRLLALGQTNHEIAQTLVVSDETVKSHVASILGKLGLANRAQAAVYALKRGLLSLDELN